MSFARPVTSQPHYGEHLGDAAYWTPYVVEALRRHDLPVRAVEAPFVGTFPTFLVGNVVVKLFGEQFDGGRSFATELAMCELLAGRADIPAPALIGSGSLFDDGWHWPYLVTERISGTAIRDARQSREVLSSVAGSLGRSVAALHRAPIPKIVAARDLLPGLRSDAASRLRRFGLPDHLVAQVPEFLSDAAATRVLVHADITADHIFVDASGLVGVIDWGDAIAADPWYELVAVYFDGLSGDRELFAAFLDGYGWVDDPNFPVRALQGVLEFQFNAVERIGQLVNLPAVATLHDLAGLLFDPRVA